MREVATAKGQRASVRLSDGTSVILGVDSKLTFSNTFGECTPAMRRCARDVYLIGEAYFDVVHDSTHPFVVHTANAVMEDIGTTFGVRAYRDEQVRVSVASGIVAFSPAAAPAQRAIVTAGKLGETTPQHTTRVTTVNDINQYLAWKDGRLVFRNAPVSEVIPELERWYDIAINIPEPIRTSYQLTATFQRESVSEVLAVVAAALNMKFELQGRTARFYPARQAR
jgi:transmembrane sensor